MQSDAAACAFIAKSFPSSIGNPEEIFLRLAELGLAPSAHRAWAIEQGEGELVGHLELKPTAKVEAGELEVVYIVRRERRNLGVATAAVTLASAEARRESVSAIVAFINPLNVASQRVVEKAGFVRDLVDTSSRYSFSVAAGCPTTRSSWQHPWLDLRSSRACRRASPCG
jgi:RimJ/RimL family protein N-acetyltransferase